MAIFLSTASGPTRVMASSDNFFRLTSTKVDGSAISVVCVLTAWSSCWVIFPARLTAVLIRSSPFLKSSRRGRDCISGFSRICWSQPAESWITASGLLISWATPLAMVPKATSRSATTICCWTCSLNARASFSACIR